MPTDEEWKTLEIFLGMSQSEADQTGGRGTDEGGKIKATTEWKSPNTGATNSTGFTALPGGTRNDDGSFSDHDNYGNFWSSTEYSTSNAWYRNLGWDNSEVLRNNFDKRTGFSCRCIKN